MELFAKIVKNEKPFTIFAKTSILEVWQGPEHVSEMTSKVKDVSFLKVTDNLLLGKNKKKKT